MSKRTNGILVLLIALGMLASLTVFVDRWRIERDNRTVQIVLDYADARDLTAATGYPLGEFLLKMKEAGVNSVGLGELSIGQLAQDGRALLLAIPGQGDKFLSGTLTPAVQRAIDGAARSQAKSVLVLPKEDWVVGLIRDLTTQLVGETVTTEVVNEPAASRYVVATSASTAKLAKQRVGMDRNAVFGIRSIGLAVVPRYGNFRGNGPGSIKTMLSQLDWIGDRGLVIFEGRDLLGYSKSLNTTARMLKDRHVTLGLIELSRQRGEATVAKGLDYQAVRVHPISASEMRVMKTTVAVDRYVRAVRERGIRVLYVRPFPERTDPVALVARNRAFVSDLTHALSDAGYRVGTAVPFRRLSAPLWALLAAALGASASAALVEWHVLGGPPWLRWLITGAGFAIFAALTAVGKGIFARQAMALVAASCVPTLAVVSQAGVARAKRTGHERMRVHESAKAAFWLLVRTSAISALGGIIVVGLLGDTRFMLTLSQFVGVKVMHVAPIIFVAMALWGFRERFRRPKDLVKWAKQFYTESVPVRALIALGVVGVIGLVYISRTGNESTLPVLGVERSFRLFLEHVLVARPRTKEFLFAHPLLMLGFALYAGGYRKIATPIVVIAALGQASIVDTHAHIHSPLLMTSLRWIWGVLLGGALGWLLIWLCDAFMRARLGIHGGVCQAPRSAKRK